MKLGLRELLVFILLGFTLFIVLFQHVNPEIFEYEIINTPSGGWEKTQPLIMTEYPKLYLLYKYDMWIFLVLVFCGWVFGDWRNFYAKMQKKE